MSRFKHPPIVARRLLVLMAGIFLLASADGAIAGNGGAHDGMRSQGSNPDRDRSSKVTKQDGKENGGNGQAEKRKYYDKRKDKAPVTTTATSKPPVAGTGINNTIHPVTGTPAPTAVSGPGITNTIHPIIANGAAGSVTVSNGVTQQQLPNGPGGVVVYSSKPGTITVSNGKDSVTLNGGSLTLSGNVIGVGGGQNVQVAPRNNAGNTVISIAPPPPATDQSNPVRRGFAGPGGAIFDGITDFGYGLIHGFAPGSAPPTTSTTTQQ